MSECKQIGWFTLEKDTVFTDNHYECAAWWRKIKVPAGKYPMTGQFSYDDHRRVTHVYIHYEGELIEDYFGSLFCGVPIGTYDNTQHAGRKEDYTEHWYDYMIADAIMNGDSRYELLPGMKCDTYNWTDYDGIARSINRIVKGE